jgi:hypothetical protein
MHVLLSSACSFAQPADAVFNVPDMLMGMLQFDTQATLQSNLMTQSQHRQQKQSICCLVSRAGQGTWKPTAR